MSATSSLIVSSPSSQPLLRRRVVRLHRLLMMFSFLGDSFMCADSSSMVGSRPSWSSSSRVACFSLLIISTM